ncbi:hypothetical protein [Paludibaculum fermentans]|uniref:hypothetical protein n=1 Tax=Paludibaculum fermentans TaxID=1473598 RepID=UPI003EBCBE59
MNPNVARPVAWIIQFVLLAFWLGVVPFILWRVYAMSKDVADIKQLLRSLLEEQKKKGAAPLPEPRPDSLES